MQTFVGLRATGTARQPILHTKVGHVTCKRQLVVRASTLAEPANFDVKSFSGSSSGTASMALRVAEEDTAKGLVHRYLIMVRQNARRVSLTCRT